tara:strand:+ start:181 stop:474 length:294 start_codon:yes stop_codon:yes gene_type:complete
MFKGKSKLSKVERKYCSCLVKVRSKKIKNPYGICTNSVYGSRNLKRNKIVHCSKKYNFKKLKKEQLKLLAFEKKISLSNKAKKQEIIDKLSLKLYKD